MQYNDMMRALEGHTILVGKNEKDGRLMVCTVVNKQAKVDNIGMPWSVPNTVSRCQLDKGMAHLKIEVDKHHIVHLTNMKAQNVTYVDGVAIYSKVVDPQKNQVALGANAWPIKMMEILEKAAAMLPAPPKEYSIAHLEQVWETYKETTNSIKRKQASLGNLRSAGMILSVLGGLVGTLSAVMGFGGEKGLDNPVTIISIIFVVCTLGLYLYCFIASRNLDHIGSIDRATDEFQDNYVCPNPECRHFMGNQPYKILRQNKNCPYCKAVLKS